MIQLLTTIPRGYILHPLNRSQQLRALTSPLLSRVHRLGDRNGALICIAFTTRDANASRGAELAVETTGAVGEDEWVVVTDVAVPLFTALGMVAAVEIELLAGRAGGDEIFDWEGFESGAEVELSVDDAFCGLGGGCGHPASNTWMYESSDEFRFGEDGKWWR